MAVKFFERDESNRVVFKALDFEVMMHNLIETTPPKNKKELEFMVQSMVDSIQLVASEHFRDNFDNRNEWEDIYYK